MPYRPVQRIVTVEFDRDPRRKKDYDVRITPEHVVVRHGDTIVWDVQGLTPAQADKVSFGKFDLIRTGRTRHLRQKRPAAAQGQGPAGQGGRGGTSEEGGEGGKQEVPCRP